MSVAPRTCLMLLALAGLAGCAGQPSRPDGPVSGGTGQEAAASRQAEPGTAAGTASDNIHLSQAERYRIKHDRGPDQVRADIANLPMPVPRVEPRSRYGNKSPYTVNGETYRVLSTAKGYDERGLASWYGKKFDGYLTSSMERYDMFQFSAASKVLPLPTWVRVTNLANGKSVIVRVNDRGPFVEGRIIDLSYAAAVRIGIWPKGVGRVEVKAIDPAHPDEPSRAAVVENGKRVYPIWLQVGAFADDANARRLAERLRKAGLPVQLKAAGVDGQHLLRVRLGPLRDARQTEDVREKVRALGLPDPKVAVD